jgi:hypothetical protein
VTIAYHNSTSNPADNSSLGGPTVAVTPPASCVEGDLVVLFSYYRLTPGTVTETMSETSGQTWNALAEFGATNATCKIFWCRFNGTWGSDPSVTITTGTNGMTVVMHVFRPTTGTNTWDVDVAQTELDFSAPSTPFTVTIVAPDTVAASTVAFAAWVTADDNSWTSIAGSGWVVTGGAQYRNLTGQDASATFAHNIRTTQGALADVSKNQTTVTGDAGTTAIVVFKEEAAAAVVSDALVSPGARQLITNPGVYNMKQIQRALRRRGEIVPCLQV